MAGLTLVIVTMAGDNPHRPFVTFVTAKSLSLLVHWKQIAVRFHRLVLGARTNCKSGRSHGTTSAVVRAGHNGENSGPYHRRTPRSL